MITLYRAIRRGLHSGGITYNWLTNEEVTRDVAMQTSNIFAASPDLGIKPIKAEEFSNSAVMERVKQVIGHPDNKSHLIGIWTNDGDVYVDAVILFQKVEDVEEFCRANKQLAYHDFATSRNVFVKY